MTHLYSAEGVIFLLRPTNMVKLLTQRAQNWICMGKWAFEILKSLLIKNEKAPDDQTF